MTKKNQVKANGKLLGVQKAATFLDVSTSSIRRWAQRGKLSGLKIGSRGDWRFTKDNLMKLTRKV
jgi:excisionase family DNA binding protein